MGTPRSAWDLLPEDLGSLGYERDPGHLFGRLQRVATWGDEGPALARPGRDLALRAELDLTLPTLVDDRPSADGSRRLALALRDGARVEAVHMPRAVRGGRTTVCLSSQVGCAMACTFCATARMGLVRNLEAHEIVAQLLVVLRAYGPKTGETLNLVFMGMGEPLHNVENVVRAIEVLCRSEGLGVTPGRITVSTAGHVPGIERLARAVPRPDLAVSVNAVTDGLRSRLMPIGKRWPLAALHEALCRWPARPHEKLLLEYVLLAGENDREEDADLLAAWTKSLPSRTLLNVIPFNAWGDAASPYAEPEPEVVERFVERLRAAGALVTVRKNRARDARGACGTLVADGRKRLPRVASGT